MSFKKRIKLASEKKQSPIVLALDFPFHTLEDRNVLLTKARNVLSKVAPFICAVKINHHLTLPLGLFNGVQNIIEQAHNTKLEVIMDAKVNDIGATNQVIGQYYFEAGFDAIIANPFVGWEEGLKPLFLMAHERDRGVILLAYMSHRGAAEGYAGKYTEFARKARDWCADGAVVGATVPAKIKEVHDIVKGEVPIFSPGVGAQGGSMEDAILAGTSYPIVGREITMAEKPDEVAYRLKLTCDKIKEGLRKQQK